MTERDRPRSSPPAPSGAVPQRNTDDSRRDRELARESGKPADTGLGEQADGGYADQVPKAPRRE